MASHILTRCSHVCTVSYGTMHGECALGVIPSHGPNDVPQHGNNVHFTCYAPRWVMNLPYTNLCPPGTQWCCKFAALSDVYHTTICVGVVHLAQRLSSSDGLDASQRQRHVPQATKAGGIHADRWSGHTLPQQQRRLRVSTQKAPQHITKTPILRAITPERELAPQLSGRVPNPHFA